MDQLIQSQIIPQQVGQFGIKATDGKWYSVDGDGFTKDSFVVGSTYNVGVRLSKTGKPYIKAVYAGQLLNATGGFGGTSTVQNGAPAPYVPPAAPAPVYVQPLVAVAPPPYVAPAAVAVAPRPSAPPAAEDKMSKSDWADKDRRISRLSVLSTVFNSQAYANAAMTDPVKAVADGFVLAEQLESWAYRQ